MSRIEFAPAVTDDFDRILSHLTSHDVADAPERVLDIVAAIGALERNPLIGRPLRGNRRELVIGRAAWGYVALYRYVAALDTVFVVAIRSQSEAGYAR